jgi:TonB family protein
VKPETASKREKGRKRADDSANHPTNNPASSPSNNPANNPANTPSARHEARIAAAELREERPEQRQEAPKAPPLPDSPPGRGRMITGGPGVQNVEVLALGKLVYPESARGTGRKLTVKVAVLVDENGNVAQARIKEGAPGGRGFNEAALDAARRSRFLPATQDGVPGKSWTDLNFEFVDPGGGPSSPQPSSPSPPTAPPGRRGSD